MRFLPGVCISVLFYRREHRVANFNVYIKPGCLLVRRVSPVLDPMRDGGSRTGLEAGWFKVSFCKRYIRIATRYIFSQVFSFLYPKFCSLIPKAWQNFYPWSPEIAQPDSWSLKKLLVPILMLVIPNPRAVIPDLTLISHTSLRPWCIGQVPLWSTVAD